MLGCVKYKEDTDVLPHEIAVVSDYVSIPNETLVEDVISLRLVTL